MCLWFFYIFLSFLSFITVVFIFNLLVTFLVRVRVISLLAEVSIFSNSYKLVRAYCIA